MKTIKDKIDILNAKIETLQIKENKAIAENDSDGVIKLTDDIALCKELIRDLSALGKFIGYYLIGEDDDVKDVVHMEIDYNGKDGKEIVNYVDECMDDFYNK